MNVNRKILLLFSGPNTYGKFYMGLHTKSAPIPPGYSILVDDEGNTLVDDEGNILIALD